MPDTSRHDQTALFELGQFALRRTRACARISYQLGRVETSLRLTEKHTEDALLCLGKQRIREAFSTGSARACLYAQCGYHRAHSEHAHQLYSEVRSLTGRYDVSGTARADSWGVASEGQTPPHIPRICTCVRLP